MFRPIALAACLAVTPALAGDLLPRLEAAQETLDARLMVLSGADPLHAQWTPQRRGQSACALAELERLRGPDISQTYVSEVEKAARRADGITRVADFGGLFARIHSKSGIRLQRDLVPITRKCGIGL